MSFLRRYRPARAVKPSNPIRPRLEVLEDRCVPSIDMVTNLSGSAAVPGSLPFEVAHAASGDTIQFAADLKGGTISLGNTLDINNNLTIDGAGSDITVNGGGNRVFLIEANVVADINALTITGGVVNAFSLGGGIFNYGSLSLTDSIVTGNSAFSGGGIFNGSLATMTMSADTVNNNTAASQGGGVDNFGTLTILNSTIAANQANQGGGIINDAVLNLVNCTVADNTVTGAGADGGGIYTSSLSQLALLNTIVYNPSSGAATHNEVFGTIAQAQGDLFGPGPISVAPGGDHGGGKYGFNPLLGPLENNGGPTATMALLSGSPAIGVGVGTSLIPGLSVPGVDQRGGPRPANSIDIGAFQTQVPTSVTLTQVLVTPTLSGETVTLTAQVSFAGGPVPEGTVTFSLDGRTVVAPVNASGQATAQVSLPALSTAVPLTIGFSYSDNGVAFTSSATSGTARFIATDALMPSTTNVSSGGGESVTDVLFGLLSLSRSYDAQGRLVEVDIDGIPLETFGYNAQGQLAEIGVMGIQAALPVGLPPQLADLLFQNSLGLPLVV
jgi:YD repeat-containing protein